MTTQTPAALTYGDTFTLPSIRHAVTGDPITFRIDDVRDIESAGQMYEDRARFTPVDAGSNRLSTLIAVKIGRAERELGSVAGMGARWAHDRLQVNGYAATLTEKMNDAVRADLDALTFDLPRYTVPELRAALIAEAASTGESLGRLHGHNYRPAWDNYQQDENARQLRGEAMDLGTRQAMHDALTAAFEAESGKALRVSA